MTKIKSLTILIAEDNQDHAELMIDTLQNFNIANKLIHVQNGEQALRYLRRVGDYGGADWVQPDLVLLDIKMPKLDGMATLEAIRSDTSTRHLPVVMVSTSNAEHEIKRSFALGANSFITKPLQFDEFTRKINELNMYWVLTSEIPH